MIKELTKRLISRKENVRPLIVSVLITLFLFEGYHFLGDYFSEAIWIFDVILLGILLSIIMMVAGFVVLKSLFLVAVELSLLIFLAQSYCDVAGRSSAGNEALKSLLIIGLIYITFSFCRSLYEVMEKHYKNVGNERWSKGKIVVVALFLFFIGLFIWQIYLVVSLIVLNLCVFK